MINIKRLERASSIFFFFGSLFAKFRYLPLGLFSAITNVISLLLFLGANVLWILACQLYPEDYRLQEKWYGFTQFKEQNKIAATLGIVGIFICFISIGSPIFFVPALWVFLISNIFWSISHFHKLKQEQYFNNEHSARLQESYLHYTILMTSLSLLTAIYATVSLFFPPAGIMILAFATLGVLLASAAINRWVDCNFNKSAEPDITSTNYRWISTELSHENSISPNIGVQAKDNAKHFPSLFCDTTIPLPEHHHEEQATKKLGR